MEGKDRRLSPCQLCLYGSLRGLICKRKEQGRAWDCLSTLKKHKGRWCLPKKGRMISDKLNKSLLRVRRSGLES